MRSDSMTARRNRKELWLRKIVIATWLMILPMTTATPTIGFYSDSDYDESNRSSEYDASIDDDEERVLQALDRVNESGEMKQSRLSSYQPRAREISMAQSPQHFRRKTSQRKEKRTEARRKRRRKPITQPMSHLRSIKETNEREDSSSHSKAEGSTKVSKSEMRTHDPVNEAMPAPSETNVTGTSKISASAASSSVPTQNKLSANQALHTRAQTLSRSALPNTQNVRSLPTSKAVGVSSTTLWVRNYLNERAKDVLLPVPKDFLSDGFNLAQLAPIVEKIGFQVIGERAVDVAKKLMEMPSPQPSYPIYRLALQLLLNEDESMDAEIVNHPLIPSVAIQKATEALYLMVHARFVTSPRGLDALRRILLNSPIFGKCPRPQCGGSTLLPYGACNDFSSNFHECQRYCACCGNLWKCWDSRTDGCAWGPSLCYLLLMAHGSELFPSAKHSLEQKMISTETLYHPNDPRVFGFRIHPLANWGSPLLQ